MNSFENVFLHFIESQFIGDEHNVKRVIIQDIPSFIQQGLYKEVINKTPAQLSILFTNVDGIDHSNVFCSKTKEGILAKRNDYRILNLAIVADIPLDRSNETSVTILNDFSNDKWRWVHSSLGMHFLTFFYAQQNIDDINIKDAILQVLDYVGRFYDNGVEKQWRIVQRLFVTPYNEETFSNLENWASFILGLPRPGKTRTTSHSMAVLDKNLNFKGEAVENSITQEIEKFTLNSFYENVKSKIKDIISAKDEQSYQILAEEMHSFFRRRLVDLEVESYLLTSFEDFFNTLTTFTLKSADFVSTPLFFYMPLVHEATPPQWWHVLTSTFWQITLENARPLQNIPIDVRLTNVDHSFFDRFKGVKLTSSKEPGLVQMEIVNYGEIVPLEITVSVNKSSPRNLSSAFYEYRAQEYLDRPISFHFKTMNAATSVKVMPIEMFSGGILPFTKGAGVSTALPVFKNKKWFSHIEFLSRGQNIIYYAVNKSSHIKDFFIIDNETGEKLPIEKYDNQNAGVDVYYTSIWIDGEIVDTSYTLDYTSPTGLETVLIIDISIPANSSEEVGSMFRKLVKTHIAKHTANITFNYSNSFIDVFESWMLNKGGTGRPVLLSMKSIESGNWSINEVKGWHTMSPVINASHFIYGEMRLPQSLVDVRTKVIKVISTYLGDNFSHSRLIRTLDFDVLGADFEVLLVQYLEEYHRALINDEGNVRWLDIHPVLNDKKVEHVLAKSSEILALLVSPYHPLRLYWHLRAQQELNRCLRGIDGEYRYNPAASALDPSIIPDFMVVKLKDTLGDEETTRYISLTNDSDYWALMVNADSQTYFVKEHVGNNSFWEQLGMKVEGLNQGLFPSQIERSLKDVSKLMVTKDVLKISLQGDNKGYEEEGIFAWLRNVTGYNEPKSDPNYYHEHVWSSVREKSLEVYDYRPQEAQPNEYSLLEDYLQVGGRIKWYDKRNDGERFITDLSIICNLGLHSITLVKSSEMPSPSVGPCLYKQRLVKVIDNDGQVPLKEQRKTAFFDQPESKGDTIFLQSITLLEGGDQESRTAIAISPRIDLLQKALESSQLSVVSSSLVSPTTFSLLASHGGDSELYLWDFDLPSFTNTSNNKNGFYLLSHPKLGKQKSSIKTSLFQYLALFDQFSKLPGDGKETLCNDLLKEYILRGLPALKKLVYGGNAFKGELGNIIALRLLSGIGSEPGLFQTLVGDNILNLIVPVDPFQDIIEKMPKDRDDNRSRPDLLVISYKKDKASSYIKITPVEVMFRTNFETYWNEHLVQASNFSHFLGKIFKLSHHYPLWKVALSSILGRMIEYSLSLTACGKRKEDYDKIYHLGFSLLSDLFHGKDVVVSFNDLGRLVFINADKTSLKSHNDVTRTADIPGACFYMNHAEAQQILFTSHGALAVVEKYAEVFRNSWDLVAGEDQDVPAKNTSPTPDIESIPKETPFNMADEPGMQHIFDVDEYLKRYPDGLKFKIGEIHNDVGTMDFFYNPGSTEVNQLNIGIIGDLGTGKTQLVKSIIYKMSVNSNANRGEPPKFLILDTKRDYDGSGSELDKQLITAINAEVIDPYNLKINIFDIKGSTEHHPAMSKAIFFLDVLGKIYGGIGPVQKDNLRTAILNAFIDRGYRPGINFDEFISPTVKDVADQYRTLVRGQVDAPLSIINGLLQEGVFEEDPLKTVSFKEMFSRSMILALGKIASSKDSLELVMVIFLKLYQEYMLSIKKMPFVGTNPSLRKIDSYILIDEAKMIMDYNFLVLQDLLRKGREFGVGVILSTQYLSDFTNSNYDYSEPLATWCIHKVPNISVKELKSIGLVDANESTVSHIKKLKNHYCLYKTVDVDGKIIRGIPLFETITEFNRS